MKTFIKLKLVNGSNNKLLHKWKWLGLALGVFLTLSCNDGFLDPSLENDHVQVRPVNLDDTPLFVPYSTRVGVFPHSDVIYDPNNRFADVTGIHGERWNFSIIWGTAALI